MEEWKKKSPNPKAQVMKIMLILDAARRYNPDIIIYEVGK